MHIKKHGTVSTRSTLFSLNPFIDEHQMLRVGGRITNSNLNYETKHPLILPPKHRITKLIIQDAHARTLHGGIQLTLSYLRKKYWITDGRSKIRAELNKCIRCHRFNASTNQQLMANLPQERIVPSRPFTHTGVDYAGPIAVRISKGRGNKSYKGYIALFVCFATKAMHIEIVSDQTAAAFVAAFKRFVSRRGLCQHIYCDNGTNFVGARTQLDKEKREALKQAGPELQRTLADIGIEWHFIPPSAPHFGGLWEAAVKSVKHHLKRIIGDTTLTYEELSTVVSQIEACLNSRPLITITSDPNDFILTPGHFLVGDSLITTPEANLLNENICLTQRWRLVQRMVQSFWKHWSNDYITSLQQRTKWTSKQPEIKIDDIVLIKDNNLPPTRWPLGRIIELHPGKDNLTRVATIQGSNGSKIKRPITKIKVLPLEPDKPKQIEQVDGRTKYSCTATRIKVSPLLLLCLVTISTIICPATAISQKNYNITKFNNQPGLYLENTGSLRFTNQQWKIVVYFNLTTYYTELAAYRAWTRNMDQLCMATAKENHQICSAINSQLIHMLIEIENKNELLHYRNEQKRQRRGVINIVGNLASDLFGVLDNRDAKHYEEEIEKLKINQEHLLTIAKNQTSISDATLNILRRTESDITRHWQTLKQQITSHLEDLNNNQRLLSMSFHALLLMLDFKETQQKLIDVLLNTHNKAISTSILPPNQLKNALEDIIHHIPSDVVLPGQTGNYDMLSLYQIMSCRGRLSGRYLIFELKLPLLNKEKYQIFKPLPLPTTERIFIQPAMDFLVTSLHRDKYSMMSREEFQHCKHSNNEYICSLLHPVHLVYNNNSICELNLLTAREPINCEIVKEMSRNPQDRWVKLRNNNWIFSLRQERQAHIVCGDDTVAVQLPVSGKISLNEGCVLKEGSLILETLKTFETRIDSSYLPAINLSIHWMQGATNHSIELEEPPSESDISKLHNRIIEQYQAEQLPISHHDIHQYTAIYGLLAICMIGFLIYFFKFRQQAPLREDYNLNSSARENVDTQQN